MKKASTGDRSVALYDTEGFTALRKSRALGQVGHGQIIGFLGHPEFFECWKIYAFSYCSGVDCVAPGDHCDPLPWQLLRTLAQLWAPCRRPCCCGFLPGFLFKVLISPDMHHVKFLAWWYCLGCFVKILHNVARAHKCIAARSKAVIQLAGWLNHSLFPFLSGPVFWPKLRPWREDGEKDL